MKTLKLNKKPQTKKLNNKKVAKIVSFQAKIRTKKSKNLRKDKKQKTQKLKTLNKKISTTKKFQKLLVSIKNMNKELKILRNY